MEIKTKITTTYVLSVSVKEIQYLRAITQNFCGNLEDETEDEETIRSAIFNACNNLLIHPASRSSL